jgi:ubiquinone/menaquinone biosynthesis C-methylase UbiE
VQGSALALPFEPASFDHVIAIGSLHHTGDLRKALDEVHRVLTDGGRASVMVYNAHSLNRLVTTPSARALARVWQSKSKRILSRTEFDRSSDGSAAPHTDFVSKGTFRGLTTKFSVVEVTTQNANALSIFGRALIPRPKLLPTLGRVAGLDLYARLTK